jgi:hypothetical protein
LIYEATENPGRAGRIKLPRWGLAEANIYR